MNRIHTVLSLQITADKREIKDFPKLPSVTSLSAKRYVQFEDLPLLTQMESVNYKMLLPAFNSIGENGMKDISIASSHLTKVKQNFFLFLRGGSFLWT